jgi:hypothetical protein
VTNALPHCDDPIELRLSYDENDLWIEVWDNDSTIPVRQDPDDHHESGRGIKLIDGLMETYGGIRGTEERSFCAGKTVFVALSLQPGQLSGHPGSIQSRYPCGDVARMRKSLVGCLPTPADSALDLDPPGSSESTAKKFRLRSTGILVLLLSSETGDVSTASNTVRCNATQSALLDVCPGSP